MAEMASKYPVRIGLLPFHEDNLLAGLCHHGIDLDAASSEGEDRSYPCRTCGKETITVSQGQYDTFGPTAVCGTCSEAKDVEIRARDCRSFWIRHCPATYRETDTSREDFNKEAWRRMKTYRLTDNMVLLGPSGVCKTRMACQWAKIALGRGMSVKLMFPEDLKDQPRFKTRKEHLDSLAYPDLAVLDDLFLVSASKDAVAEFIKDLIDRRLRDKKATVITSQVDADDFESDAAKFDNLSSTENQRIEAIVRRVKESYATIDCGALASGGEEELF